MQQKKKQNIYTKTKLSDFQLDNEEANFVENNEAIIIDLDKKNLKTTPEEKIQSVKNAYSLFKKLYNYSNKTFKDILLIMFVSFIVSLILLYFYNSYLIQQNTPNKTNSDFFDKIFFNNNLIFEKINKLIQDSFDVNDFLNYILLKTTKTNNAVSFTPPTTAVTK